MSYFIEEMMHLRQDEIARHAAGAWQRQAVRRRRRGLRVRRSSGRVPGQRAAPPDLG
jgi:hypothetical protein